MNKRPPTANPAPQAEPVGARAKLLGVAMDIVRRKGFAATSVDELCAAAGVTKGAFFHHFATKEALGVAAVNHWSSTTGAMFAAAPFHEPEDALERVLAYIDFRAQLIDGPVEAFSCVAGTMVQEAFRSSEPIRAACEHAICSHAETLEHDIALALKQRKVHGVDARGLALHIQAVLQGGFVVAKATGDAATARECTAHLKRYLELLFRVDARRAQA